MIERNPPVDGAGANVVHLRRRRESITAVEVIAWMKARGLEAEARDIEWALEKITQ